jgi:hypothetical protein
MELILPSAPLDALRRVALFATLAAALGVTADLALEFTTDQRALLSPTYQYLLGVSAWRLALGLFLGVCVITFQIAGFWVMCQVGRSGGARSASLVFLATAFSVVVGAAFHASVALVALLVQATAAAPPDAQPALNDAVQQVGVLLNPLAVVALLGLVGISLWYAWLVARGRTPLPRWLAFFNPLAVFLLCAVLGALIPLAALALDPAALNISTFVTFLALTLALWRLDDMPPQVRKNGAPWTTSSGV